jgi:hypothetical protein
MTPEQQRAETAQMDELLRRAREIHARALAEKAGQQQ